MFVFITASLLVLCSAIVPPNTIMKNRYVSRALMFLLFSSIIVYIPFLDFYISDMSRYVRSYQTMHYLSLPQALSFKDWEPLFITLQWVISRFSEEPYFYVLSIFILYSLLLIFTLNKLFKPWQQLFVMFLYLLYPYFYAYVFNGTRQGFSMMFLILAISILIVSGKKLLPLIYMAISFLFHKTSLLFTLAILVSLKFKTKTLVIFWVLASLLFLTGLNKSLLSFGFIDSFAKFEAYSSDTAINHYGGVNRKDFYFFSLFFLVVPFILRKYIILPKDNYAIYEKLLKIYISFNTVFLLLGFIAYSDRLAVYSWMLIPLLVSYPFLYNKKNNWMLIIVILLFLVIGFSSLPFIKFGVL